MDEKTRVLIMGAGGRDFHTFNTCYRDDPSSRVVAFTAAQIPHIEDRTYPPQLSGDLYPDGIPIRPESSLEELIRELGVDRVVFAYSDVSLEHVDEMRERVEAAGAAFSTFDVEATMVESRRPVVAVVAVRTGCGKSQTSRRVAGLLKEAMGLRVAVVRHPMPYGNLERQIVQRFATIDDLEAHECTIEEMEEYEPHIARGNVVYAGADYERILRRAEEEADVILWDGGNNDTPFFRPDLWITLVDPLRPGHELRYFPGRTNFERADAVLINKVDQAEPDDLALVRRNIAEHNPDATVLEAASPVILHGAGEEGIRGRRVLVIEDGPTVTHGEMGYGAGFVAARRAGAAEIVDPRPYLQGELEGVFEAYGHLRKVLPAMGYGPAQIADLEATVNRTDCDAVIIATPIDLGRVISIEKPHVRVTYELEERSEPGLRELLAGAVEVEARPPAP